MGKAIRHVNSVTDKVVNLSEMLANDKHYLKKMKLVRADAQDIAPTFKTEKPKKPGPDAAKEVPVVETSIKEDVLAMSLDDLKGKYRIDHWVVLARELRLKGNHSNTGEEKLINKIKDKLSS